MSEIYELAADKGIIWKCQPSIRYFMDSMHKTPVIQQLWVSETGEQQWRQIPLVYEPQGISNVWMGHSHTE